MRKANIIHLSDIHFDNSNKINDLLDKLKNDLLEMKEELNEFHLLLITGDCVDKGQVNQFECFSKKLDKIIKDCGIAKKKVAISIGNHDADLDCQYLTLLKGSSSENGSIENLLLKLEPQLTSIYQEYNKVVKKYIDTENGIDVSDIIIKDKNKIQFMRIRLIILNSSWSTTINNKYGELTIGELQLKKICDTIKTLKKKCDFVILCLHHPLDWFKYEDRKKLNELIEYAHVDFLFHGHIHTSNIQNVNNIDNDIKTFCTGISYRKNGKSSSSKSGMRYSIYQIDKYTKTMNVYIRSTNEKGKFVPDTILYSNVKNGFFTLPLENIVECLMPFNSVETIKKHSIVLTKSNVEKILSKEQLLFDFYCAMAQKIDNMSKNKEENYRNYQREWMNSNNLSQEDKEKNYKTAFENEQFGLFCYEILINLNALFFHGNVRFLIRKYNVQNNSHDSYVADGICSTNISKIRNFQWKDGLIYQSFIKKSALLESCNIKYFKKGNSNVWKNSLTIAVRDVSILINNEPVPALSMNIAIDSYDNESCLEALALSSIYQKIGKIFTLYSKKVYDIKKIIMMEDNV